MVFYIIIGLILIIPIIAILYLVLSLMLFFENSFLNGINKDLKDIKKELK